jgi:RNA polymerase sigma-54 factor
MIKQHLSQRQLQKLSPQQIQLMKLLQIPTATLDQRIKEELEANPALDEGEEELGDSDSNNNDDLHDTDHFTESKEEAKEVKEEAEYDADSSDNVELDEYLNDYMEDDVSSYKLNISNYSADDEEKTMPMPVEDSFHEQLERQLGLINFNSERNLTIAEQIVGSIDDDGYLRREPAAIVDDLMFSQNIFCSEEEIEDSLKRIQKLDPPGIGARTLQEALAIQLHRKNDNEEMDYEEKVAIRLALRIVEEHFSEFSKKHYARLQRQLNINERQLKTGIEEILKLNPKPASGYSSGANSRAVHYIVPDFTISNKNGELELELNSRNAPDLRVNDGYRDMLHNYSATKKSGKKTNKSQREAVMFIKQKIDSARWFIDAIKQRQQTMYRTMYTILQLQYDYFATGDERKLRPMILKDIAEMTGLDISTVSRVANSKYVQTEFGTKRLKDFFSESLQTQSGEEVSTLEVKKILTDIIGNENKKKPLSDEKLKALLQERGYNIARRTVAKYREQLSISVARLRKEL